MPLDPCTIPPGREWSVLNCDAEIPGPQWDAFVARGRFQPGIQKGLDESAHCFVNVDVWVKRGADRVLVQGARIPGFFPWGWYKVCRSQDPPDPPDPAETVRVLEAAGLPPRPRAAALEDWSVSGLPTPCVVPVPDIDVWIPWPASRWPALTLGGRYVDIEPGGFGRVCRRIPGSAHPMFSTGLGIQFIVPAELSPAGQQYVSERYGSFAGMPGSWYVALFDDEAARNNWEIRPAWYTRDFSASHMQCLTPLRKAPGVPVNWRWRIGGRTPAPYVGAGADVFDIEVFPGAWANSWLRLLAVAKDDEGVPYASRAPEWPFGIGQFNGPPPGEFS